jgi:hypothetical protein
MSSSSRVPPPEPPEPGSPPSGPPSGPLSGPSSGNGPKIVAVVVAALLAAAIAVGVVVLTGEDDSGATDAAGRAPSATTERADDTGAASSSPGAAASPSSRPIEYVVLKPGQCFDHPKLDSSVHQVEKRSCTAPHRGEVISNRVLTGDFDSEKQLASKVDALCAADARKRVARMPRDGRGYSYYALYPTLTTYTYQNQDEITCALTLSNKKDGPRLSQPLR